MNLPPDTHFNDKSNELERSGKVRALSKLHAEIFVCLASAQAPISCAQIGRAVNLPEHSIHYEIPRLLVRLRPLGIAVKTTRGNRSTGGRSLVFEDVPKWKPTIAPPIRLEGEA